MDFVHLPIPDRGLPEQRAFAVLAHETLAALRAGVAIGAHCRAGIGRSGILACCILALSGLTAEEAIARVSEARRITAPDTEAPAAFIRDIVAHMPLTSATTIDGFLNAH
jgi:protein-tyrosine phosphatase